MASPEPDQRALMKDILDSLKALQVSQMQLASNVDAINGRVNILAGIKEVHEVAIAESKITARHPLVTDVDESHDHTPAPDSPSIPAVDATSGGGISVSGPHSRTPSVTSRIILT